MSLSRNLANRSIYRLVRTISNQRLCRRHLTYEPEKSKCIYCGVHTTNLVTSHKRSNFEILQHNLNNNKGRRCMSSHSNGFNTQDGSSQTSSSSHTLETTNLSDTSSNNETRICDEEVALNSPVTNSLKSELYFHGPSCSAETKSKIESSFLVLPDFISTDEEDALLQEVEPHLKRLRYESDHWDDAIVGFRETEVGRWSSVCSSALRRLRDAAFSDSGSEVIVHTHILDLLEEGHIKPHIDSVRFCGTTISGLSLGSTAVMRLVREGDPDQAVDVLLPRRSLYIMRDEARYHYTHEVLSNGASSYLPESCRPHRARRISVICRNQPT